MNTPIILKKPNTNSFDEAHLVPYEKAARIFCQKLGINPDEIRQVPHPGGLAMMVDRPCWRFAADELVDLSLKLASLREAVDKKDN